MHSIDPVFISEPYQDQPLFPSTAHSRNPDTRSGGSLLCAQPQPSQPVLQRRRGRGGATFAKEESWPSGQDIAQQGSHGPARVAARAYASSTSPWERRTALRKSAPPAVHATPVTQTPTPPSRLHRAATTHGFLVGSIDGVTICTSKPASLASSAALGERGDVLAHVTSATSRS